MTTNLQNRMNKLEVRSGVNDSRTQVDEIWLKPISPTGEPIEPVLFWKRDVPFPIEKIKQGQLNE
jgi:hypothetical protein